MRQMFKLTIEQERLLDAAGERMFDSMPRDGVVPYPNAVSVIWDELGRQMGFDPDTVEFLDLGPDMDFSAEVKR